MSKAILPLLIAALTMTACASGGLRTQAPTLNPPQSAIALCEPLPQPASGAMTDLLINHNEVARSYHQCRDRHPALINWLEATNDALSGRP